MKIYVKCDVCNGDCGESARWYSGKTKHNLCQDCATEEIPFESAKNTGKCAFCYKELALNRNVVIRDGKIYCSLDCAFRDVSYMQSLED